MNKLETAAPPDRVVLCDLDGVVWLAHEPIVGSVEAIQRLRDARWRVVFVTNASFQTVTEVEEALLTIGVEAFGDVLTSAMAAGRLVNEGERVLVCGGAGLFEQVVRSGCEAVYAHEHGATEDIAFDAVVVGLYRELTYDSLTVATRAVSQGARFVASNTDPIYPTPHGPLPGGGSLVSAIQTSTQVAPVIAGKPHQPMADLVNAACGALGADNCWMVGDRHDTDGDFARRLGVRFGHVLSGTMIDVAPCSARGADLAAIADIIVAGEA